MNMKCGYRKRIGMTKKWELVKPEIYKLGKSIIQLILVGRALISVVMVKIIAELVADRWDHKIPKHLLDLINLIRVS